MRDEPIGQKKPNKQEETTDFLFPPLANGVDYLANVAEPLNKHEEEPNSRNLKYVVLHLQAAVEVLLKSQLQLEHWPLVFKDSGKATRARHASGDFQSVGSDEVVRRLIEIVGIKISESDKRELDNLAQSRNSLQH